LLRALEKQYKLSPMNSKKKRSNRNSSRPARQQKSLGKKQQRSLEIAKRSTLRKVTLKWA